MAEPKISPELMDLLNQAIARELQVSIQYMWQHVMIKGTKGQAIKGEIRAIAMVEMTHAEQIAERLAFYGGIPTPDAGPVNIGNSIREMIEINLKVEEKAIELYKNIIQKARGERDEVTAELFTRILADEEWHYDSFASWLVDL